MESFPIEAPVFSGESRVVPSGNAFEWLKQGWAIFMANPGMWLVMTVILIIMSLAMVIVPFIGSLALNLLMPVLGAGLLLASRKATLGEALDVSDLFAGFKAPSVSNLVILGAIYMGSIIAVGLVLALIVGGSVLGGNMAGHTMGAGLALGGMMFGMLLSLALFVPLIMAIWYAPALVFFNNMMPVEALKASFNACLKNTLPFLVYGLIVLVLCFFAALPIGLGFLVLIPVLAGSTYVSYRDIFVAN